MSCYIHWRWRVGRPGCVVSDVPLGGVETSPDDLAYYGGHLVCESIPSYGVAVAIASLPDLVAENERLRRRIDAVTRLLNLFDAGLKDEGVTR